MAAHALDWIDPIPILRIEDSSKVRAVTVQNMDYPSTASERKTAAAQTGATCVSFPRFGGRVTGWW
jgi:hypothetical protein